MIVLFFLLPGRHYVLQELKDNYQRKDDALRQREEELESKDVALAERHEKVIKMEQRFVNVEKNERELDERIRAHQKTEDEFYKIHAAQINNRHAKELEDAESLLADQVKQVSELQKEKRQLTELLAERDRDIKALQDNVGKFDEMSQVQSETKTPTLMDGHSDDILSLNGDKLEARMQMFKALSRTETLVRLVLQQEGQPTITSKEGLSSLPNPPARALPSSQAQALDRFLYVLDPSSSTQRTVNRNEALKSFSELQQIIGSKDSFRPILEQLETDERGCVQLNDLRRSLLSRRGSNIPANRMDAATEKSKDDDQPSNLIAVAELDVSPSRGIPISERRPSRQVGTAKADSQAKLHNSVGSRSTNGPASRFNGSSARTNGSSSRGPRERANMPPWKPSSANTPRISRTLF